jgi:hypothetical protein
MPPLGPTQIPNQWLRGSYPGVKLPGREVRHSSPSGVEVKNEWSYTSTTPAICLHLVVKDKLAVPFGRAMAQAVSRRSPTAEARVRSRVSPCGICGGQSGTGTGFSSSTSVSPC